MDEATGEAEGSGLRVAFDRRLKLEFHGATVTSDAGLLAFRELDDALGLTAMAAEVLADPRTGRNGRHSLIAQLRQSVFGRLAGYEDVNDADRLGHAPEGVHTPIRETQTGAGDQVRFRHAVHCLM